MRNFIFSIFVIIFLYLIIYKRLNDYLNKQEIIKTNAKNQMQTIKQFYFNK